MFAAAMQDAIGHERQRSLKIVKSHLRSPEAEALLIVNRIVAEIRAERVRIDIEE